MWKQGESLCCWRLAASHEVFKKTSLVHELSLALERHKGKKWWKSETKTATWTGTKGRPGEKAARTFLTWMKSWKESATCCWCQLTVQQNETAEKGDQSKARSGASQSLWTIFKGWNEVCWNQFQVQLTQLIMYNALCCPQFAACTSLQKKLCQTKAGKDAHKMWHPSAQNLNSLRGPPQLSCPFFGMQRIRHKAG